MGGGSSSSGNANALAVYQTILAIQAQQSLQETIDEQSTTLSELQTSTASQISDLEDTISSLTTAAEAAPPDNAAVATSGDTASADTTGTSKLLGRASTILTGNNEESGDLTKTTANTNKKTLLGS